MNRIEKEAQAWDQRFVGALRDDFSPPEYQEDQHVRDLSETGFYRGLLALRHVVRRAVDEYFSCTVGSLNVDLFMLTPSISSPIGPGSDSEGIPISFGGLQTFLVDSSQFGFEPILLNNFKAVHCYLPSMRGEDHDYRHLNQFYHAEIEMVGGLEELFPIAEGMLRYLAAIMLACPNLLRLLAVDAARSEDALKAILNTESIPKITLESARQKLHLDSGMLSPAQEERLASQEGGVAWLCRLDRDLVPFYQKPDVSNPEKTLSADLLVAPIVAGGFGGEILGSGQRQDDVKELRESLARQGIDSTPYEWYIRLREHPGYRSTSGFGMGVERFLAWSLGLPDIRLVIPYPRLKGVHTLP